MSNKTPELENKEVSEILLDDILKIKSLKELKETFGDVDNTLIQENEENGEFISNKGKIFFTVKEDTIVFIGNNLGDKIYDIEYVYLSKNEFYIDHIGLDYNEEGEAIIKNGKYVKINGDTFDLYDTETLEKVGAGFYENGDFKYIEQDGEIVYGVTDIDRYRKKFKKEGTELSFDENREPILDNEGNYVNILLDNKFYSYDKNTLKKVGIGLYENKKCKYITLNGENLEGVTDIDLDNEIFEKEGTWLSYDKNKEPIIEDGNYVRIKGGIFNLYNKEKLEKVGAGFYENGNFTYITLNGENLEGVTDIDLDNEIFEKEGTWLSYDKNKEPIMEEGNYVEIEGDTFSLYDTVSLNKVLSGFYENGNFTYITLNGENLEGVTGIDTYEESFTKNGVVLSYNKDKEPIIEDGKYVKINGCIFDLYDTETLEKVGAGFHDNGVFTYIEHEGKRLEGVSYIYGSSFDMKGQNYSYYIDTKKPVVDSEGDFIRLDIGKEIFSSYNPTTLKQTGTGFYENGDFKHIKLDGEKLKEVNINFYKSIGIQILGMPGRIKFNENKELDLEVIKHGGNKYIIYGDKYYFFSGGIVNELFDENIIDELNKKNSITGKVVSLFKEKISWLIDLPKKI